MVGGVGVGVLDSRVGVGPREGGDHSLGGGISGWRPPGMGCYNQRCNAQDSIFTLLDCSYFLSIGNKQ